MSDASAREGESLARGLCHVICEYTSQVKLSKFDSTLCRMHLADSAPPRWLIEGRIALAKFGE